MSNEQFQRLRHLFSKAVKIAPDSRAEFYEKHCEDDPQLRMMLESMVREADETLDLSKAIADNEILARREGSNDAPNSSAMPKRSPERANRVEGHSAAMSSDDDGSRGSGIAAFGVRIGTHQDLGEPPG